MSFRLYFLVFSQMLSAIVKKWKFCCFRFHFCVFNFLGFCHTAKKKCNFLFSYQFEYTSSWVLFVDIFLIFWPVICSTLNKQCLEIWSFTWLWLLGIWFIFLPTLTLKYFKENSRELGVDCESLRHTHVFAPKLKQI